MGLGLSSAWKSAGNSVTNAGKSAGNSVTNAASKAAGELKKATGIDKAADKAAANFRNLGQAIAKPFEDMKDQAQTSINAGGRAVAKPFEDIYDQANTNIGAAGRAVAKPFEDASDQISKGVQTAGDSIEDEWQSAGDSLENAANKGKREWNKGVDYLSGEGGGGPSWGPGGEGRGGSPSGPGSSAAQIEADALQEGLDYAIEADAIPRENREGAITQLGARLGLNEDGPTRFDRMLEIRDGAEYQHDLAQGGEFIMRNHAATGGARSGNTRSDLGRYQGDLARSMYNDEIEGLEGLAYGLPSNSNAISQQYGNIGRVGAMGQMADYQMQQDRIQNRQNMAMGIGGGLIGLLGAFSDPSLKKDVEVIGKYKGLPLCKWTWNDKGEEIGMVGDATGVMADDVELMYPHLINRIDGVMRVDYEGLSNV